MKYIELVDEMIASLRHFKNCYIVKPEYFKKSIYVVQYSMPDDSREPDFIFGVDFLPDVPVSACDVRIFCIGSPVKWFSKDRYDVIHNLKKTFEKSCYIITRYGILRVKGLLTVYEYNEIRIFYEREKR